MLCKDVVEIQSIIAMQRRRKTVVGLMTPVGEDEQVVEEVSVAASSLSHHTSSLVE